MKAHDAPVLLALGGLIALAAGMGIGRFVYTPILPPMVEALGLSKSQAGLIASANYIGYLVGALAASSSAVRGSPRGWLLGGLLASAATTGGMGAVSSLEAMLAMRFLGGVASAFVLLFASSLVLDRLAAAGRSGLSSIHFGGVGVGIAVSAVLVAALLAADAGWRVLWLASGGVALAAMLAVGLLVPNAPFVSGRRPDPTGTGALPRHSGLMRWIIAYGLFGIGYVVTATFLVAIVRAEPAMRPFEPVIWLIVGLACAPSVTVWNRVGRRIGVPAAFAAACLAQAVGVVACVLFSGASAAFVTAVLLGGTVMGQTALGLAGARAMARDEPRRTMAVVTAAFGVGQIVGPVGAGVVFDLTGSFLLPSLLAAMSLVAAAAMTWRIRLT